MSSFTEALSTFAGRKRHNELRLESRRQIKKLDNTTLELLRFQNLGAFFLNVAFTKYYNMHKNESGDSLPKFLKVHLSRSNLNRVSQLLTDGRLKDLGYEASRAFNHGELTEEQRDASMYTLTLQVAGMIYVDDRISEAVISKHDKINMDSKELYSLEKCWKNFEELMKPLIPPHSFDEKLMEDERLEDKIKGVEEIQTYIAIVKTDAS